MTIKEYILSKPDDYKYEIVYQFENYCPKCRKNIASVDDEYSSGINTAIDFKNNPEYSHYRGYPFVYDDFYIDDNSKVKCSIGDERQEIITITVTGEEEICSNCEE